MRFKKVFFVNLPYEAGRYSKPLNPPASLGYLAEYISSKGLEYDVLDMSFGYSFDDFKKRIKSFKPDLIGFSVFSFQYLKAYEFIKRVKTSFPDISLIAGGPHPSLLKEKILTECPFLDYAVAGDGEETLYELMSGKDIPLISGLAYRKDKDVLWNGVRDFNQNLDIYPFPKYQKFELKKYLEKRIPVITSRGCPFSCIYCSAPKICGKRVRFRSPLNILEEIQYWYDKGYRTFPVMDDNFIIIKKRAKETCQLISERKLKDCSFLCPNGIRADCVDEEILSAMKKAGFKELSYGVEVGNDKMLKIIKKNERISDIDKAVKLSCEMGFRVTLFFIIGFPEETFEDFMDCVNFALKYPVMTVKFFNLIPYPQTELFDYINSKGLFRVSPEDYLNKPDYFTTVPVFDSPGMSFEEKIKAIKIGRETEIKVVRKFLLFRFKNNKFIQFFIKIAPLKFILNLYWENPFFRRIFGMIRYR